MHIEIGRILPADAEGSLHDGAAAYPHIGIGGVGVVVQTEAGEGLVGHMQKGQLLALLLTAQLLQAGTHGASHIAGTAALGAEGRLVQITRRKIGIDQSLPLLLQRQILLPGLLHGGSRVLLPEDRLGSSQHGTAKLAVDLTQTGHPGIGIVKMLPVFRFPVGFRLCQPILCTAYYLCAVCHGQSSCSNLAMAACSSASSLRRGGLVSVFAPVGFRSPARIAAAVCSPASCQRRRILFI